VGKAIKITISDLSGNAGFAEVLIEKTVEVSQQLRLALIIGA
jgi:hypothetical protein